MNTFIKYLIPYYLRSSCFEASKAKDHTYNDPKLDPKLLLKLPDSEFFSLNDLVSCSLVNKEFNSKFGPLKGKIKALFQDVDVNLDFNINANDQEYRKVESRIKMITVLYLNLFNKDKKEELKELTQVLFRPSTFLFCNLIFSNGETPPQVQEEEKKRKKEEEFHNTLPETVFNDFPKKVKQLDLFDYQEFHSNQLNLFIQKVIANLEEFKEVESLALSLTSNSCLEKIKSLTNIENLSLLYSKERVNEKDIGNSLLELSDSLKNLSLSIGPSSSEENPKLSNELVETLEQLKALKNLNLACRSLEESASLDLAKLPILKCLNLFNCKGITDTFIHNLGKSKTIQTLCLSGNGNEQLTLFGALSNLKNLKCLVLTNCSITNGAIKQIIDETPIESIFLQGCNNITDEGFKYLSQSTTLKSIALYCCPNITDKGLEYLSQSTSLKSITLHCCLNITDKGLEYLTSSKALINLEVLLTGDSQTLESFKKEKLSKSIQSISISHESYDENRDYFDPIILKFKNENNFNYDFDYIFKLGVYNPKKIFLDIVTTKWNKNLQKILFMGRTFTNEE